MILPFFADNFQENDNRMLKSAMKAFELILVSAGLITTLLILKGAMTPYSCELVFSSLMGFRSSITCLLSSPLYICIIINSMIVLIALSSSFQTNNHDNDTSADLDEHYVHNFKSQPPPPAPPPSPPREVAGATPRPPLRAREIQSTKTPTKALYTKLHDSPKKLQILMERSNLSSPKPLFPELDIAHEAQEFKKKTNPLNPTSESTEVNMEVENSHSDDKENEEEDTIEATWKLITGGGDQKPKKKELKKSETWVLPSRTTNNIEVQILDSDEFLPSVKWKDLRKSETFNDTVSIRRNGGLRRDPSVSLDEFNNQVEAFIKKFNADMRLQRQESDQRFLEMINQGL